MAWPEFPRADPGGDDATYRAALADAVRAARGSIEKKTDASVLIWAGSCFGACDLPTLPKGMRVDLVVQWGHAGWR